MSGSAFGRARAAESSGAGSEAGGKKSDRKQSCQGESKQAR